MSSMRDFLSFSTFKNEMSICSLLFVSFGARMQCATSKLADAVDTECHRERSIIRIGKNWRFLKSVPFPLKAGRAVIVEFEGRKELKGREERKGSLGMKDVERSVRKRCARTVPWGKCWKTVIFACKSGKSLDGRMFDRAFPIDQGIFGKMDAGDLPMAWACMACEKGFWLHGDAEKWRPFWSAWFV